MFSVDKSSNHTIIPKIYEFKQTRIVVRQKYSLWLISHLDKISHLIHIFKLELISKSSMRIQTKY